MLILAFFSILSVTCAITAPFYPAVDNVIQPKAEVEEDANLTVPELIEKYGYPVEVHHVETDDGYILEMHRIPYGVAENAGPVPDKPVVYVQHGNLASSADWIIAGPKKGLAYLLADLGYDVWMGNVRGNRYSRKHKELDPEKKAFWQYSWHEIGVIDLPNMIDYVLEQTGVEKVFYIGHSQGTTTFYVMASERPEYNDKIRAQFSLAPVAYSNHIFSPFLRWLSLFNGSLEALLYLIGMNEWMPRTDFLAEIGATYCSESSLTQYLCTNSLFVLAGFNIKQLNKELLPVIMGHTPAGCATKQLLHFAQLVRSGQFRQYDYGYIKNLIKYKSIFPPSYDLSKITAPVALHYSKNDWLSAETDVLKLNNKLSNSIGLYLVTDKWFNHLDYMWGIDVDTLVYDTIFSLMTKY